jgi:pantoate--beta-alanine ligase
MANDVEIIAGPTIREADGLAMSSRNVRLSEEDRVAARIISKALYESTTEAELRSILSSEPALTIDYADYIDEKTFQPPTQSTQFTRAIVAGWINGLRLLDNMPMKSEQR